MYTPCNAPTDQCLGAAYREWRAATSGGRRSLCLPGSAPVILARTQSGNATQDNHRVHTATVSGM